MDKKKRLDRHWKYFVRKEGEVNDLSRKSKKAVKQEFEELRKDWEKSEEGRLYDLPDCSYCEGSGTQFFHECEECEGTGKTGWVYQDRQRVPGKQVNHV
ncbi:hypothetical protein [Paenibacillus polymyxa]|uniref:hypothetical protein n=1 Tax=Paenibacillus polymyxa TaxID=1406 RepID=UPI0007E9F242|nr:hypothetical protein [Paenibacillus polymyxa]OAZ43374.1 hypothetical protein A9Z39_22305 [Paenibacillus polymyxa]